MRRRSSTLGRQRAETSIITPVLSSSDQNVPWVSGSQPLMLNSSCGRNHAMPKGPVCNHAGPIQPEADSVGSSKVYVHTPKPTSMPTSTPRRLAPRQYRPPSSPGANWATAAKAINPYEANELSLLLKRLYA